MLINYHPKDSENNFGSLWDYSKPEETEKKFRAVLAELSHSRRSVSACWHWIERMKRNPILHEPMKFYRRIYGWQNRNPNDWNV